MRRSSSPTVRISWSTQALVGLAAGDRERQHQVLLGGQDRQQVEELEDEAELVAAQLGQLAVVEGGDLDPVELDRAAGRLVEAGEDVHQRRLARAGGPHDRGEAIALEAGADPGQRVDRRVALAVATGEVGGDDDLSVQSSLSGTVSRRAISLRPVALADQFDGLPDRPRRGRLDRPRAGAGLGRDAGGAARRRQGDRLRHQQPGAAARRPTPSGCRGWGSRSDAERIVTAGIVTARLAGEAADRRRRLRDRRPAAEGDGRRGRRDRCSRARPAARPTSSSSPATAASTTTSC